MVCVIWYIELLKNAPFPLLLQIDVGGPIKIIGIGVPISS